MLEEQQDDADEAERILALSDEELDGELREAGLDPKAVRDEGRRLAEHASRATGEGLAGGEAWVSGVVPLAPRRSLSARWTAVLAAAVVVLAASGALLAPTILATLAKRNEKPIRIAPDVSASASSDPSPREIREHAFAACASRRWTVCLDLLDMARGVDPAGDADERVNAARQEAEKALELDRAAPPDHTDRKR